MTGGQLAPTTPKGKVATTARQGSIDPPFDACQLAIGAGATYVARGTSYHTQQLDRLIEGGITHKGFALIEILENCNTYYGRPNKISLLDLLQWEKNNTVNVKAAERMTTDQLQGKILTGLLHQSERQEYVAQYEQLIARTQATAGARA
jgi:2-oxoglutarate ferredoxin oxidoreductase subunit beta